MEIIDLKKYSKNKLLPVSKYGNVLLLSESAKHRNYQFSDPEILNYHLYHIDTQKINKIDRDNLSIVVDAFHEKKIEGEDAYYYITSRKQLFENQYFLNRINIEEEKSDTLFQFKMEKKYIDLDFEVLDNNHVLIFYKEEEEYDFENFDYAKDKYGYDKGILYTISNGEEYEIKDKDFLRGFRLIFFTTTIMNEKCVVFEENYLEPIVKEQIYMEYHMNRTSKKEKFFHRDCLKYSPLERFLTEVKAGKEKISFIDIESRGIKGYEMFSGVDEDNIYYRIEDFGEEDSDALVMLDKHNLSKKIIKLPKGYDDEVENVKYIYSLEGKYKSILQFKNLKNNKVKVKELINGNVNYTYSHELGSVREFVEDEFLIACRNNEKTSIIDIKNNDVKSFSGENKIFDDFLVLY